MVKKVSYNNIYQHACNRKGGEDHLESLLVTPLTKKKLTALPDRDFLSAFTKKIFQSGFVWKVVEKKWPEFEELFWQFDTEKLCMMPDEMLEQRANDKRLIRNARKIFTVRDNAMMMEDVCRREKTTFAKFVANWPTDDITGLWLFLKKHGSRLGGNTGPYALRSLGVDTFLLTRDVEGFLRENDIINSGITTKSALNASQQFFNQLREESGRPLCQLSQIISYSYGSNRVGVNPAS